MAPEAAPATGKGCLTKQSFLRNYCWTHGHQVNQTHRSTTCGNKAAGHKDEAMSANTMGGSEMDKE
jgi:hypothetical protein